MNTPEESVGDLAIALGIWMATGQVSREQRACFVESVLVLAHAECVNEKHALAPLDLDQQAAKEIWKALDAKCVERDERVKERTIGGEAKAVEGDAT